MREYTIRPYAQRENQMKNVRYEQVTVKVPKAIMTLLRRYENQTKISANEYIEQSVVEMVRADLDAKDVLTEVSEELEELLGIIG
jgi:hypothetical protein